MLVFFFFKQKTAYDMRISDWSSDVFSSDLFEVVAVGAPRQLRQQVAHHAVGGVLERQGFDFVDALVQPDAQLAQQGEGQFAVVLQQFHVGAVGKPVQLRGRDGLRRRHVKIGRGAWRERVCQYV